MLRKIPVSALPFARDGVLPAARLGIAEGAERLERHARGRAADIATSAREDAARQFDEASRAGYRDGLERALSTWLPKLADVLGDEAQLKSRARQALDRYLHDVLTDAGIEAALIARCCESVAGETGTGTLHVPDDRRDLVERLAASAPDGWHIRRGEAPWPVVERGDVVIEIDPKREASRHLGELLEADALHDALEQRARAYADSALRELRNAETRTKLRQHEAGSPP